MDSRLRRSPPDRASAVPYGQAGENAMRFPHLAHRSAAAHKLHSTPQQDRMNLISGNLETSSRLPVFSFFLPGSCPINRDRRKLFQKFDAYKIAASHNTVLWYNYIDAIGEKLISTVGELSSPLDFSEFCKSYHDDQEFLYFFDQLHMFVHFMGRKDEPWSSTYDKALSDMIGTLQDIEKFISKRKENLLGKFEPKERNRTTSAELAKYSN